MRTNAGRDTPVARQDTEPYLDQNAFNLMLESSPSVAHMLDNYATGTFFEEISGLSDALPSGQSLSAQPAPVLQPATSSASASLQITPASLANAIYRVNASGGGCVRAVPAVIVNSSHAPVLGPLTENLQGGGIEYNSQGGAGMYSMVPQGQHLQPHLHHHHQQQQQQHQQPLPAMQQPPQMQFHNYADTGFDDTPEAQWPSDLMGSAQPQNAALQCESNDTQENLGYQGDSMSAPNIGALSSLPNGVMQVQTQMQAVQSCPVTEGVYLRNTQQATAAPFVSGARPGCFSVTSSRTLQVLPQSPETKEVLDAVVNKVDRNHSYSQLMEGLPLLGEGDFSVESKFNPNPAIAKKEPEVNAESLPRADSIEVMQLSDWPGEHNFTINFPSDVRNNRKWSYCDEVKRVFCQPNIAIEVQVRVRDWSALERKNASVRLCPVYTDAHYRTTPVTRCDLHKISEKSNNKECVALDYLIQIDQKNAEYGHVGQRQVVSAPLQPSSVGEEFATLLVKCSCMTSCVGGPNRRPFAVIFSLMVGGQETGRRVLALKCCKGVFRDMKAEKNRLQAGEGPAGDTLPPPPSVPQSPKTHTITINLEGKKRKACRTAQSDNSDSERSPGKRTRSINRVLTMTEPLSPPSGYCHVLLPVEYKQRVVDYLNALKAQDYLRNNHPDVCRRYNI